MPAAGDVTDEAAVQGYINSILEKWGRLDIVVNNAALLGGRGVLDETAEAFERAVRVSSRARNRATAAGWCLTA